ncbi:RICIN domain-containing protein [Bailinhaonella thermotolerans]|uniref:Uncharacterized protein n=1 Tax=Bailinhaonella thermotolerans TaxID=1070861 RepID=A0A3A4BVW2_9ACTN|nr:RICIN domain-containing protein [Bailinhaonella thermotolerans]RJL35738.1 hypothetical protein D5H75_02850 [Bailinhaonella thermotolerans]
MIRTTRRRCLAVATALTAGAAAIAIAALAGALAPATAQTAPAAVSSPPPSPPPGPSDGTYRIRSVYTGGAMLSRAAGKNAGNVVDTIAEDLNAGHDDAKRWAITRLGSTGSGPTLYKLENLRADMCLQRKTTLDATRYDTIIQTCNDKEELQQWVIVQADQTRFPGGWTISPKRDTSKGLAPDVMHHNAGVKLKSLTAGRQVTWYLEPLPS